MAASRDERSEPNAAEDPSEDTPLLSREDDGDDDDNNNNDETGTQARPANRTDTYASAAAAYLLRAVRGNGSKKVCVRRWPSLLALLLLCIIIVIILIFAFLTPQIMKEYSSQAIRFEPTSLSISSLTATGVVAHIKGDFNLDASRVKNNAVRNLGKLSTWIAREVESKPANVSVSLPEYGDPIVGTAEMPKIKVNVRNKHVTSLDFETTVYPSSKDAMRRVADDWIKGKLSQLEVRAAANVSLQSGLFTFPKQAFSESLVFEAGDSGELPDFKIRQFNVREVDLPDGNTGLSATASIKVKINYPVELTVPPLGFTVLIPNCGPSDPHITLGDANTAQVHIKPKHNINLNVTGFIRRLPKDALVSCPETHKTPLDILLGGYLHGNETTIYVQASDAPSLETPQWLVDIIKGITVPVPFPGKNSNELIKDFTLQDTHFDLPDFFADPDSPDSKTKISGTIRTLIRVPDEINFPIDVDRVRASTNLYYRDDKFASLDLSKWQSSSSKLIQDADGHNELEVKSFVDKAPLSITNTAVFAKVVREVISGGSKFNLTAKANVDVDVETALGQLVVRDIPARGNVPVNPLGRHNHSSFAPRVHNLHIADTTPHSIAVAALVNITNPTPYTANVPFIDVKIEVNGTVIGHVSAQNISIVQGESPNIEARVFWDPRKESGANGTDIARELLSQYLSGYNTSLTFKAHEGSLPAQPDLGKALSTLNITLPLPPLDAPGDGDGDDDDGKPHFIREATMHLLSSTTTFTLHSPLTKETLYLDYINATAFYKAEQIGRIEYPDFPGAGEAVPVPPGDSTTQRLPVSWKLGAGFDALKDALGGELKLDTEADVWVRLGRWHERLWFRGKGIGAKITF